MIKCFINLDVPYVRLYITNVTVRQENPRYCSIYKSSFCPGFCGSYRAGVGGLRTDRSFCSRESERRLNVALWYIKVSVGMQSM